MFVQILNEVADQINREYPGKQHDHLFQAINIWCQKLDLNQNETDYIREFYFRDEVNELTNYLNEKWNKPLFRSDLFDLKVWKPTEGKNKDMKFCVIIAFAITAIGYCIYKLNKPKQQQTHRREETIKSSNNKSFTVQNSSDKTPPTPPTPIITKQFLVLVVSHLQADFMESLKAKRRININEGEALYEITKYLWLGAESEFSQMKANLDRYLVSEGAESEYDIYLVYIELNKANEGFKPNVNQLNRFDAFRKLADLSVNLTISPRLQMEAYENIGVYYR